MAAALHNKISHLRALRPPHSCRPGRQARTRQAAAMRPAPHGGVDILRLFSHGPPTMRLGSDGPSSEQQQLRSSTHHQARERAGTQWQLPHYRARTRASVSFATASGRDAISKATAALQPTCKNTPCGWCCLDCGPSVSHLRSQADSRPARKHALCAGTGVQSVKVHARPVAASAVATKWLLSQQGRRPNAACHRTKLLEQP